MSTRPTLFYTSTHYRSIGPVPVVRAWAPRMSNHGHPHDVALNMSRYRTRQRQTRQTARVLTSLVVLTGAVVVGMILRSLA
jgi:hypothetical protein